MDLVIKEALVTFAKVAWVCGGDTSLTEVGSRENERKTIGNNKNNQYRTFAMKGRRETHW